MLGLCRSKWGLFALIESLEQSHLHKFWATRLSSSPKIHVMHGPSICLTIRTLYFHRRWLTCFTSFICLEIIIASWAWQWEWEPWVTIQTKSNSYCITFKGFISSSFNGSSSIWVWSQFFAKKVCSRIKVPKVVTTNRGPYSIQKYFRIFILF